MTGRSARAHVILHDVERCERTYCRLAALHAAGLELCVVLGADELRVTGGGSTDQVRACRGVEREAVALVRALVVRDCIRPERLLAGVTYDWQQAPSLQLHVRLATIEEAAHAQVRRLRGMRGLALRRAEADAIAATLEVLLQRSHRPVRAAVRHIRRREDGTDGRA